LLGAATGSGVPLLTESIVFLLMFLLAAFAVVTVITPVERNIKSNLRGDWADEASAATG
jgi:hypothetical protein